MKAWIVYRTGWNAANQSSRDCDRTVAVARVQAEDAEEACASAKKHVTVYNNQYLSARLESEVLAEEEEEASRVELL